MGAAIAVVMPAYNAAAMLRRSLPAARASLERAARSKGAHGELIVVDPGSTDGTAEVAEELGARVLRLGRRAGPAEARNEGVALTTAPVVLFIDSDCVAHEDVVERVLRAFELDGTLVSLTGSYDDQPPERDFFSQYMNLRHHFVHHRAKREGASFWAGCGAVRRTAFERAGGFDPVRFPRPMIEDIELGLRMKELGATRLDPELQVTHLKRWSLRSVVATDVLCRALPWSRLIRATGEMPDDLNLRLGQRIAAAIAPFALVGCVALPVAWALSSIWLGGFALVTVGVSLLLHLDLLRFFARRRGVFFAVAAWLFHQVHLTYSAATFAFVTLEGVLGAKPEARVGAHRE